MQSKSRSEARTGSLNFPFPEYCQETNQTCLTMAFSAGSHVASVALATSAPPPSSVSCSLFLACVCVCKGGGFLLSAETSLSGRADCEFCAFLTSSF